MAVKVIKNKPAYRNQAMIEIQIVKLLNRQYDAADQHHLVRLLDCFEFQHHLCLAFELLHCSLLDVLTERQFRGLPLRDVRAIAVNLLQAMVVLQDADIIHCDLKPENILLVRPFTPSDTRKLPQSHGREPEDASGATDASDFASSSSAAAAPDVKLIDFGSACNEGHALYSYVQSRFYRSPEVILGVPYNGAIDLWSLGCVLAELFLGLPLLPGASEHNQLCRIVEMFGHPPSYLLELGKHVPKLYKNIEDPRADAAGSSVPGGFVQLAPRSYYRLATAQEYAAQTKTSLPPVFQKYFRYDDLKQIILRCPLANRKHMTEEQKQAELAHRHTFLDLLSGLLAIDPWQRWTAKQATQHPFITGAKLIIPASHTSRSTSKTQPVTTEPPPQGAAATPTGSGNPIGTPVPPQSEPLQQQHQTKKSQSAEAAQDGTPVWSTVFKPPPDEKTETRLRRWREVRSHGKSSHRRHCGSPVHRPAAETTAGASFTSDSAPQGATPADTACPQDQQPQGQRPSPQPVNAHPRPQTQTQTQTPSGQPQPLGQQPQQQQQQPITVQRQQPHHRLHQRRTHVVRRRISDPPRIMTAATDAAPPLLAVASAAATTGQGMPTGAAGQASGGSGVPHHILLSPSRSSRPHPSKVVLSPSQSGRRAAHFNQTAVPQATPQQQQQLQLQLQQQHVVLSQLRGNQPQTKGQMPAQPQAHAQAQYPGGSQSAGRHRGARSWQGHWSTENAMQAMAANATFVSQQQSGPVAVMGSPQTAGVPVAVEAQDRASDLEANISTTARLPNDGTVATEVHQQPAEELVVGEAPTLASSLTSASLHTVYASSGCVADFGVAMSRPDRPEFSQNCILQYTSAEPVMGQGAYYAHQHQHAHLQHARQPGIAHGPTSQLGQPATGWPTYATQPPVHQHTYQTQWQGPTQSAAHSVLTPPTATPYAQLSPQHQPQTQPQGRVHMAYSAPRETTWMPNSPPGPQQGLAYGGPGGTMMPGSGHHQQHQQQGQAVYQLTPSYGSSPGQSAAHMSPQQQQQLPPPPPTQPYAQYQQQLQVQQQQVQKQQPQQQHQQQPHHHQQQQQQQQQQPVIGGAIRRSPHSHSRRLGRHPAHGSHDSGGVLYNYYGDGRESRQSRESRESRDASAIALSSDGVPYSAGDGTGLGAAEVFGELDADRDSLSVSGMDANVVGPFDFEEDDTGSNQAPPTMAIPVSGSGAAHQQHQHQHQHQHQQHFHHHQHHCHHQHGQQVQQQQNQPQHQSQQEEHQTQMQQQPDSARSSTAVSTPSSEHGASGLEHRSHRAGPELGRGSRASSTGSSPVTATSSGGGGGGRLGAGTRDSASSVGSARPPSGGVQGRSPGAWKLKAGPPESSIQRLHSSPSGAPPMPLPPPHHPVAVPALQQNPPQQGIPTSSVAGGFTYSGAQAFAPLATGTTRAPSLLTGSAAVGYDGFPAYLSAAPSGAAAAAVAAAEGRASHHQQSQTNGQAQTRTTETAPRAHNEGGGSVSDSFAK